MSTTVELGRAKERYARLRAAVEGLAAEWRYNGEFGWGAWQEGEGPDYEGQILDECSSKLRDLLAAVDS